MTIRTFLVHVTRINAHRLPQYVYVLGQSKIRLGQTGIKVSNDTLNRHYRSDFCDKFTTIEGDEQELIDYE